MVRRWPGWLLEARAREAHPYPFGDLVNPQVSRSSGADVSHWEMLMPWLGLKEVSLLWAGAIQNPDSCTGLGLTTLHGKDKFIWGCDTAAYQEGI